MSSEVATGHVSIFPVMTGFKARVTRETKGAGAAGARSFEGGFKGVGTKAGRALGRDLKSALSSGAGDLGAPEMRKLTGEVASASAALARARLKQQDDAGRVRVAETRLAEAIAKSGEGSSQAVAAEERLASVRRTAQVSTDAVTAATQRMRAAQETLRAAQAAVEQSTVAVNRGLRGMLSNLRSGYRDANAARSAFSGVAGSVGGMIRGLQDVTGLSALGRLARLQAQQVSAVFTSMATAVGGRLASIGGFVRRGMANVGATFRGAFGPTIQYANAAATLIASPFINLGRRVSTWMSPFTSQVSAGFTKAVNAAGPAASRMVSTFAAGASRLGSSASSALQSVVSAASNAGAAAGRALGSGIQTAATGAATIAAAGIGIALGKGFSRLGAIDTARAKLTGLGNSAEDVQQIMGDALASVRGTAFGLGEAATVAAAAVAANIRPGEALQGHLKSIANNASAAGISMEEMGSIFNRAATQANGVQNDVISQLADRGIPIYQALADQLGVTAGEVFKMASEGKVDFETFSKAATAAAGTVADEMGKTVPGAAKNFFAAMGRIGANALEPIYGKIGPLIAAATSALGPVEERAKALGQVLLNVLGPAMDFITNLLTRVGEGASLVELGLGGLQGFIGPLAAGFAALGAGGLAGLLARLGPLSALLPGLGGALAALGSPLGIVAALLGAFALQGDSAFNVVGQLTGVIDSVVGALPGMIAQFSAIVPQIIGSILSQVPALLRAGATLIEQLIQGILVVLPSLVVAAINIVSSLVDSLVSALPYLIEGAMMLVTALIQGIIIALPQLVTGALALVNGLLTAIVAALPIIIQGGIQLLLALVLGIINALPMLLQAALTLVMGLLSTLVDNLPLIIQAGIQLLTSLIIGLLGALPQLIATAIQLVLQLVAGLLQMLPELIQAGITLVVSLITGLLGAIPQIIDALPQIIDAIITGFSEVDWLSLGADIIQGIIDGFFSMVGAVGDAIGEVVGGILDFFPHSPAKKGPLSAPGWRQLKTSGAATLEQFNAGARSEADGFGDALVAAAQAGSQRVQAAMGTVSTTLADSPAVQARAASPGGPGPGWTREGNQFVQHNTFEHMPPEEGAELAAQRMAAVARRSP